MNIYTFAAKNLLRHWKLHVCTGLLLLACYLVPVLGFGLARGAAISGIQNFVEMQGGWFVVSAYLPDSMTSLIENELMVKIDRVMKENFRFSYLGYEKQYEGYANAVNMRNEDSLILPESIQLSEKRPSLVRATDEMNLTEFSGAMQKELADINPSVAAGFPYASVWVVSDATLSKGVIQCTPTVLNRIKLEEGNTLFLMCNNSMELQIEALPKSILYAENTVKVSTDTAQQLFLLSDNSHCSKISLLFSSPLPYDKVVKVLREIAPVSEKGIFETFPVNKTERAVVEGLRLVMPDVRIALTASKTNGIGSDNDNWNILLAKIGNALGLQHQLYIGAGILYLLVFFSVFVTMYVNLSFRSRELATCRIIGARKSKVFWLVVNEHLFLSFFVLCIGIFIQIVFSVYIKNAVFFHDQFVQLLGQDNHYVFHPSAWSLLLCGAGIFVIPLLGALPVLIPMIQMPPMQALTQAEQGW